MAFNEDFLDIDGSVLEGGGQILRNTIALSALLHRPVRISKIRAGRDKPGLKAQHSSGIQLVQRIVGAKCQGCQRDSQTVEFRPPLANSGSASGIPGGEHSEDIGTAGSICLLIQAALPVLAFAQSPSRLRLRGGTNVDFSPPVEHFEAVLAPLLESTVGLRFSLALNQRGFFPRGGGEVALEVAPMERGKPLAPIRLVELGQVERFSGRVYSCGTLPAHIADEMASTARRLLASAYPDVESDIAVDRSTRGFGNGCGLALTARTSTGCLLGANALGRRGTPARDVAAGAVNQLLADLRRGACVDVHTQDQLIIFMALAGGESSIRVGPLTLHTRTAVHVAEILTGVRFEVAEDTTEPGNGDGQGRGNCVLRCCGIGLKLD